TCALPILPALRNAGNPSPKSAQPATRSGARIARTAVAEARMEVHHWWFILALALGVGEMLTAGFYLLVLALGALAAGAVAWAGGSSSLQLLVAAVVSVVGWSLLWRRSRARAAAAANEDGRGLGLDVGERLHIEEWLDGRRTRVSYRGAQWTAELDER